MAEQSNHRNDTLRQPIVRIDLVIEGSQIRAIIGYRADVRIPKLRVIDSRFSHNFSGQSNSGARERGTLKRRPDAFESVLHFWPAGTDQMELPVYESHT